MVLRAGIPTLEVSHLESQLPGLCIPSGKGAEYLHTEYEKGAPSLTLS